MGNQKYLNDTPAYLAASVGILWIWSGVQPLLTEQEVSLDLLGQVGVGQVWQMPVLRTASALDVVLGLACFSPLRRRAVLWAVQLVVVVVYSLIVGLCLPEHWLHPFAPLLKNLPIAALMFYLMKRSGK